MLKTLIAAGLVIPLITPTGIVFAPDSNIEIAKGGKSDYVIVYPEGSDFLLKAASSNLSKAIKKATGADIKFVTDKTPTAAGAKKPCEILIGSTNRKGYENVADGLLYGDYSVEVKDNCLCINAPDPKMYAEAVKYITAKLISEDGFCVPNNFAYVYRPDYEIDHLELVGSDISEYTVVYSEASESYAKDFADTVRDKTGIVLDTADKAEKGKNIVFALRDGKTDSYSVKHSDGNITVSAPTGMGLEAAYNDFYAKLFEAEGNIMNIESVDIEGSITPTDDYVKYISVKDGIANTRKKLTEDKKLNVAYYGGSVTVGHAASDREKYSWRARTTQWLKDNFPEAEINEINAAIGASGSHLGAFRAQHDVVSQKPDLLFIEFAINDSYNGENENSASENYEAIVRQVWRDNPDCDIVNIYVTDSGRAISGTHMQADAHEKIASVYGIPSLRVGNALVDKYSLKKGTADATWKNYFTDIVHMTDKGFEEYFLCIREFLADELIFGTEKAAKTHTVPEKVMENCDRALQFITVTPDMIESLSCKGYTYNGGVFQNLPKTPYNGYLTTDKASGENSLTFTFTGSELSLFMSTFTSGNIQYTVDGKKGYAARNSMNNPFPIVKGLEYGEHTVTMKIIFGDTTTANIGGFLVR